MNYTIQSYEVNEYIRIRITEAKKITTIALTVWGEVAELTQSAQKDIDIDYVLSIIDVDFILSIGVNVSSIRQNISYE